MRPIPWADRLHCTPYSKDRPLRLSVFPVTSKIFYRDGEVCQAIAEPTFMPGAVYPFPLSLVCYVEVATSSKLVLEQ